MPDLGFNHAALLDVARIPERKRLYFVGPFCPRITFYSQQVRALQLAHALHAQHLIGLNETVAVVGAGAAGTTLATALALLDYQVTLYDRAADVLQLQSNSPRLLHPHIYEWPRLGSLDGRAGLPLLDWTGGPGKDVVAKLRMQFETLQPRLPKLHFQACRDLTSLVDNGGEWELTFDTESEPEVRKPKHVILTLGFGTEITCGTVVPEDYWAQGAIGTAASEPNAVNAVPYVVSGNGDGALTVALSLLIKDFEHDKFTRNFLDFFAGDELRQAAEKAFAGKAFDEDAEPDLLTHVLPTLQTYGAIDKLRPLLRSDRKVTLNTNGPLFAAQRASQLNQCMVLALLEAARVNGAPIVRSSGKVTACTETADGTTLTGTTVAGSPDVTIYKHAILRHGPNIAERYQPLGTLFAEYKQHVEGLRASNPERFAPPQLDNNTFDLFEARRIECFVDAPSQALAQAAFAQERRTIEIAVDPAAHVLVERGAVRLGFVAEQCERLPEPYVVDLHVSPEQIVDAGHLIRLARCSESRIVLRAATDVLEKWKMLSSQVVVAPVAMSPRAAQQYGDPALTHAIDASLMRRLDLYVQEAIDHGAAAPLGEISAEILGHVGTTWATWRAALDSDPKLRNDFLRWLANVEQNPTNPWTGELGDKVRDMGNALILVAATHAGQFLVPCSDDSGNLGFETSALAIGTGCRGVGNKPLSSWSTPEDWGVDALILSAANDVVMAAAAGSVLDAGAPEHTLKSPRRVAPAIIQADSVWRGRLNGPLAQWVAAVANEFAEWRKRQDEEIPRMVK